MSSNPFEDGPEPIGCILTFMNGTHIHIEGFVIDDGFVYTVDHDGRSATYNANLVAWIEDEYPEEGDESDEDGEQQPQGEVPSVSDDELRRILGAEPDADGDEGEGQWPES